MTAVSHRSLMLFGAVFYITLSFWTAADLVFPAASSSSASRPAKRWAQLDFSQNDSRGDVSIGKAVTLTVTLGGVTQGAHPIVAVYESSLFEPQMVTLEPDPESSTLKGTVTLEPVPSGRISVHQKAARIQITFARTRQNKFERIMKRIFYLTLDQQEPTSDFDQSPPSNPDEVVNGNLIVEEVQPDVEPVSSGALAEEDLMPLAEPGHGQAYWKHVSYLVSRSWAKHVRGVRRGPSGETVRVHFRLYPNGRAQMIEIEKGAGSHEINVAGIYAIVDAQPFPTFPAELGDEAVDVHVRMRTGARLKRRKVQSTKQSSDKTADASNTQKK
ncbi:TonB C-terminal domain-containing protein [Petrachloros mirabilis]